MRRNVRGDAAAELAVLDALVPLLPDDHRLNERRAVLLLHSGDESAAYELLRGFDADRLDDDARFAYMHLLLRRGAVPPAVGLLDCVDLGEADRLNRLLGELAATEPPLLDRTARELVTRLPEEADLRAVPEHTARRLTSPELIADVARMLYSATRVCDFGRRARPRGGGLVVRDALSGRRRHVHTRDDASRECPADRALRG